MENTQNNVTNKVVISINELAKTINISHNAVRNWVIKPIPNQPYNPNQVNYVEVRKHLHAYFNDESEFIKLVGCGIDDLEISYKATSNTNSKKRNNIVSTVKVYHTTPRCIVSYTGGFILRKTHQTTLLIK